MISIWKFCENPHRITKNASSEKLIIKHLFLPNVSATNPDMNALEIIPTNKFKFLISSFNPDRLPLTQAMFKTLKIHALH